MALPDERGAMKPSDVIVISAGDERDRAISAWATGVWEAIRAAAPVTADAIRAICKPLPPFQSA